MAVEENHESSKHRVNEQDQDEVLKEVQVHNFREASSLNIDQLTVISSSSDGRITTRKNNDEELDGESSIESGLSAGNNEKDPRIRARKYQLDLCKKAVEENIIVYLGTGCGKTHIAVLLIYELRHLIKKPQKDICVFLAPTIPLVQQQASVIEEDTDFKVGSYYGHSKRIKNHQEWEKETEKYEVLVMTPQILLHNLVHRLIKMELIALMIFDECHHAQAQSSHPYAEIMKEYKNTATKRPRIFGMTASPIMGKGGATPDHLPRGINSLEKLLDAKVYSVEENEELERFVSSPSVKCYYYNPAGDCKHRNIYLQKLEEIKNQCIGTLKRTTEDLKSIRNAKGVLQRLQDNLLFCFENLGVRGATQAVRILLTGDQSVMFDMIDAEDDLTDNLTNQYLTQVASVVDSNFISDTIGFDSPAMEALKVPVFSHKLLVLIQILSSCRLRPNMKCIVFVNRIIVARTLSYILKNLECLSFWKCHFLVGFHSGLKNMSRKNMNSIVEKFRSGELNLLVATRVGEEGLDIQTCCLVIRFDLPETVASFIQSRGRARMPQSEYAFLVERENQNELHLINHFLSEEDRMHREITCRTSGETFDTLEEANYRVPSTGACISSGYSVSLLYRYCAKLPHDEYFIPKPEFFFFDDNGGVLCHVILPSNAALHEVRSPPQSSKEKAKKLACLRACEELHLRGALTDHLLPVQDDEMDEELIDSETHEDEIARGELHEMLSPSALKNQWTSDKTRIHLNFYFIQFVPVPSDRLYQNFGLFVKDPLPKEAETMELDLHLAHGRIVKTKLIPLGVIECDTNEIIQARNFQEMFLRIILDREDFFSDFVQLGRNDSSQTKSSSAYLLLPVRQNQNRPTVDWKLIRKCLSSPVFGSGEHVLYSCQVPAGNHFILADGPASESDIVNSLVFTPHNKLFFFIDGILGIDANSPFSDDSCSNYVAHYAEKFGIRIAHRKQPLLKAKQLFSLHNLLHNRVQGNTEARELDEHFVELPPELCCLKIIGFSKDIGSSLSLLPSLMHRLENFLVAIELKNVFSQSFAEGGEVTSHRLLEAITTEKCMERFSLERLEVLGDAFLKYAVGRRVFLMHGNIDEGQLTRKRSSIVNNSHLYKLAIRSNLQVYIRDQNFDPSQFFALGRPCRVICDKNTERSIHLTKRSGNSENGADPSNVKCNMGHHWLHKKTIADIVEALVGAFLVDSGFKAAIAFLNWIGIEVDFEASQISDICMASRSYLSLSNKIDISTLEKSLEHRFLHKGLLVQAFVHPSFNKHIGGCYQRLEFLGDAVLDYLITSYLFSVYPKLKPGQLTDLRSVTVNNNVFANVAVCRSFHTYIISDSDALSEAVQKFENYFHTRPAKQGVTEGPRCPKALGDLVESIVGAVLLDTGFDLEAVWRIMLSFLDSIMTFSALQLNPVRELTELCQSHNWEFNISTCKKGGAYSIDAHVIGKSVNCQGSGTDLSKKGAMKTAARDILSKLKALGYRPKKSNSLEQLLKSSEKKEAKLIGFDETPTPAVLADDIDLENLIIQENSPNSVDRNLDSKSVKKEPASIHPFSRRTTSITKAPGEHDPENMMIKESPPSYRVRTLDAQNVNKEPADISPFTRKKILTTEAPGKQYPEVTNDNILVTNPEKRGMIPKVSAKSRLYEICAAFGWEAPIFECVREEGQCHLKLFTLKVTVKIPDIPRSVVECFSDPQPKKKAAEEHAAEGALWYLKQQGYAHKDK